MFNMQFNYFCICMYTFFVDLEATGEDTCNYKKDILSTIIFHA